MYHLLNGVLRNVKNIGSAYAGSIWIVLGDKGKRGTTAVGVLEKHMMTV